MSKKIQVDLEEAKRVFLFLEELNSFFHQPDHYETVDKVHDFWQQGMYEELRTVYYDIVWNWLPPTVQKEIEDRPSPFLTGELGDGEKE